MSLDVHLEVPHGRTVDRPIEKIFVRRDGSLVEITRAEWDELYPGREPVAVVEDGDTSEVFWANITHNLNTMAREAGMYEALWRPEEIGATHAHQLIEPLRKGLAVMDSDRERLLEFNPPNGWGDYDGLLTFAARYLAACMKWPDATVRVSR